MLGEHGYKISPVLTLKYLQEVKGNSQPCLMYSFIQQILDFLLIQMLF